MHYVILKTPEFDHWYCDLSPKEQVQIDKRLSLVELDGHFGVHKQLLDVLWELKWLNGRRVYYAYIPPKKILVLLGGNKNGQGKDISQAKKLLSRYTTA